MMTSHSRARAIATQLVAVAHGYLDGKASEAALVRRLRKLADRIEATTGDMTPEPAQSPELTKAIERVFRHWQRRMTKPRAQLTTGRRAKIKARLGDGYTEAQLCKAIDACCASTFHMGENDRKQSYNDLTLIFRTGEKLEQFLEMAGEQDPSHDDTAEIRRLRMDAQEALKRGDTDAYNNANSLLGAAKAASNRGTAHH